MKLQLELRVDWSDLDYFGHVNNISFFRYIQPARVQCWDQIGLTPIFADTKQAFLLASCKCDFKRPLHYPGKVVVYSELTFIKNTSFGLTHKLFNNTMDIVADALDVMVYFDFVANIKKEIPVNLRTALNSIESIGLGSVY